MKTRRLFIGIALVILGLAAYGCFGFTEKTGKPTDNEREEFETMSWIDYKDMDFGVSLEYPSNWEIDKKDNTFLTFTPKAVLDGQPSPYFIKIVRLDNYDNKSLTEYLNLDSDYSMSKIGVDNLVAIKRPEPPESFSHFYYVERAPYIYKFIYMNLSDKLDYVSNQTFYEVLNSFRFIPFTAEEKVEEEIAEEDGEKESAEKKAGEDVEEAEKIVEEDEEVTGEAGMHYFTSAPYKFKALYPANWYYTGVHLGGEGGILHRYSFSDEPDGEIIATLDIVDEAMPAGATSSNGHMISKASGGDKVVIYVSLSEQVYKITAPSDMEKTADEMALSVTEFQD